MDAAGASSNYAPMDFLSTGTFLNQMLSLLSKIIVDINMSSSLIPDFS